MDCFACETFRKFKVYSYMATILALEMFQLSRFYFCLLVLHKFFNYHESCKIFFNEVIELFNVVCHGEEMRSTFFVVIFTLETRKPP